MLFHTGSAKPHQSPVINQEKPFKCRKIEMEIRTKLAVLTLASLLIPGASKAGEKENKSDYHLLVVDPNWPAEKLPKGLVHVDHADETPDTITASERDRMIAEANLEKFTKDWKQLDKNMLFLRSTYLKVEKMHEQYPTLSMDQLKKVAQVAAQHDAGHRL